MSFIADAQLEARAIEVWRKFALTPGFDIEKLLDLMDLRLLWETVSDGDQAKIFGALVPEREMVILNERHKTLLEEKSGLRRFTIAHEIGHWILHVDRQPGQIAFLPGIERVLCRERSREAIEIQAERFGSFLLCPTEILRQELPAHPWQGWPEVYWLAKYFGVTPTAMIVRLEQCKRAHRDEKGTPHSGPAPVPGQLTLLGN